jgi:hypothetical protein
MRLTDSSAGFKCHAILVGEPKPSAQYLDIDVVVELFFAD